MPKCQDRSNGGSCNYTPALIEIIVGTYERELSFCDLGGIPLGSLLGGFLGNAIGIRATLFVGELGVAAACLWITFSPVVRLRSLPQITDEETTTDGGMEEQELAQMGVGS